MTSRAGRWIEILSLLAIALGVAIGGRALLLNLQHHRTVALTVLAVVLAATLYSLGRSFRPGDLPLAVVVTKNVTYLAVIMLVAWIVVAPAGWLYGVCIVAAEVALAFDIVVAARPPAGATSLKE